MKVQVWHEEMQRYQRTGRLDQGPCWCDDCVAAEIASQDGRQPADD